MAIKLGLEWAFEAVLKPRHEELIQAFKPAIVQWANKMHPRLRENLRGDPLAGLAQATEMLEFTKEGEGTLYVFVAMCVNRDIGDDVSAFVAASKHSATAFADSWLEAMHTMQGGRGPTKVFE